MFLPGAPCLILSLLKIQLPQKTLYPWNASGEILMQVRKVNVH